LLCADKKGVGRVFPPQTASYLYNSR
jgi:hypothetical protein